MKGHVGNPQLHWHSASDEAPTTTGRTIRWAFGYDFIVNLLTLNRERALRAETIALASIKAGDSVLDVGCGTGSLTRHAKAAAGQQGSVYGIDAAPEMIQFARGKATRKGIDVEFQPGVIEALQFPDSTFDIVLSSLMFHHLPGDLKSRGLAECYRVLKPGGKLLIVDFRGMETPMHLIGLAGLFHPIRSNVFQDLKSQAQNAGFAQIETGSLKPRAVGYLRARRPQ
jgi:SAM-dependent methyltransferase